MKVLKWVGIGIGSLVGLVVIFVLVSQVLASFRLNKVYTIEVETVTVPSDADSVERGRYLATAVSTCTGCHTANLGGEFFFDDPAIGQIYSANLTPGEGGKGAFYTDEDWGLNQHLDWKADPVIHFVFQDPWLADDDTDIEYVYLHLMTQYDTNLLTPDEIAPAT